MTLPPRAGRATLVERSGALFSFDAADVAVRGLVARTGQAPTFTRADDAYHEDAWGRLALAVHSEPRIAVLPGPGGVGQEPCLMLERTATTLLTAPEDFTDAAWTTTNATPTGNQSAAPVATRLVLADRLLETAASGAHRIEQAVSGFTAAAPITGSIYVKPIGRTALRFWLENGSDRVGVEASLVGAGSAVAYETGNGAATHVLCAAKADGWFRLEWGGTLNAGSTSGDLLVGLSDGAAYGYAGDVAKGVDLWGAFLLKDYGTPTSYPSGGISRVVEALTYPFLSLPQELTMYVRFVMRGDYQVDTRGLINVGGGPSNTDPRALVYQNVSGLLAAYDDGPGSTSGGVAPSIAVGDWVELRGVLQADGGVRSGASVNGGAEVLSPVGTAQTPPANLAAWGSPTIELGRFNTGSENVAPIRRALVLAGDRSMAECRGAW